MISMKNLAKKNFSSSRTIVLPKCDFKPQKYTGPSIDQLKQWRAKHMHPAIFLSYKNPLDIVQGHMQFVYDTKGDRYLDALGGILSVSVGHAHPKVIEAGKRQMDRIMHCSTVYLNDEMILYAKELAERLPPELDTIYVVNSGGEANDLATFMAKNYTGNHHMVSLRNSYHGCVGATYHLTALNSWKLNVVPSFGFEKVQVPNLYRTLYPENQFIEKYVNDVKDLISYNTAGQVAGFIAEPIQGAGGFIPLPSEYLQQVYKIIRDAGGICVSDEVQTGFGRLGSHYWGFESKGVVPDMVTMAKSIGNGATLAAVATRRDIAMKSTGKLHFNTFGGNPFASAIGRAVLKVIDEEKTQENCLKLGKQLKDGLLKLKNKYEIIGDVRGEGFMQGVEFVLNKESKVPNPIGLNNILERTKEHKLLLGKGGLSGNVMRIAPIYCFNKDDVNYIIDALDLSLEEYTTGKFKYF